MADLFPNLQNITEEARITNGIDTTIVDDRWLSLCASSQVTEYSRSSSSYEDSHLDTDSGLIFNLTVTSI